MTAPVIGYRPCDRTWWVDPTGETLIESDLLGPFPTKRDAEVAAEELTPCA